MIICRHCGAETSNGLALCDLCQRYATSVLGYLPIYIRNLSRWKPGRAGSRQVPGSRGLFAGIDRTGTGDRISDRLDEATNMLTTWARVLLRDRPGLMNLPRPLTLREATLIGDLPDDMETQPGVLCEAFVDMLTSLATLDWCGEFVRDLGKHDDVLRRLTETAIPGWYAGGCKRCSASTYVVPGLTWVTCRSCGATTYARDHLEVIIAEAEWWIAPPKRIAEALVALLDTEQSVPRLHDRIRQWGARGRIETHRRLDGDGDEVGPARYRLGRVMEVLMAEGQTRTGTSERVGA